MILPLAYEAIWAISSLRPPYYCPLYICWYSRHFYCCYYYHHRCSYVLERKNIQIEFVCISSGSILLFGAAAVQTRWLERAHRHFELRSSNRDKHIERPHEYVVDMCVWFDCKIRHIEVQYIKWPQWYLCFFFFHHKSSVGLSATACLCAGPDHIKWSLYFDSCLW